MKNRRQIVAIALIVIILAGGYSIYKNRQSQKLSQQETSNVPGNVPVSENVNNTPRAPEIPSTTVSVKSPDEWQVFQEYLGYLKNHDAKGVNSVLSEHALQYGKVCPMRKAVKGATIADCDKYMDSAYDSASKLSKGSFVTKWTDGKQTILSTDIALQTGTATGENNYEKIYLFFTKNDDGQPRFLALYRIITHITYTNETQHAQKIKEAFTSFNDSDQDGLLDQYENCKAANTSPYNITCSNTDKNTRDSFKDGWWDGVRVYFGDR